MIIQNFDIVFMSVVSGIASFFPKDRIFVGKQIDKVIAFSSEDITANLAGQSVISISNLNYLFLSLYSSEKHKIFKNFSLSNILPDSNISVDINTALDYDLTRVDVIYNDSILSNTVVPIGVVYTTETKQETIPTNNVYSINIKTSPTTYKYKLSDFGGWALRGQKIRRITVKGETNALLTIRDKNGKNINKMPLSLLVSFLTTDIIYLDNLDIDFENSFIEIPFGFEISNDIELTFYF